MKLTFDGYPKDLQARASTFQKLDLPGGVSVNEALATSRDCSPMPRGEAVPRSVPASPAATGGARRVRPSWSDTDTAPCR